MGFSLLSLSSHPEPYLFSEAFSLLRFTTELSTAPVDSMSCYPGGFVAFSEVALQVEQRRFPVALLQGLAPRVSPYTLPSGLDSTGHRRLS